MISALEFLKAKARMTNDCNDCGECPFACQNNPTKQDCATYELKNSEQAIEIVENWAKENPVKTYKSRIQELFPECDIENICISTCPRDFFKAEENCACIEPESCWDRPYKEDNNV